MLVRNVADLLQPLGLLPPDLEFLRPNEHQYTALLMQPSGPIFANSQRIGPADNNLAAKKGRNFLELARTRNAHLAVTPEYFLPWSSLRTAIIDGVTPPADALWVLGSESITEDGLEQFKKEVAGHCLVLHEPWENLMQDLRNTLVESQTDDLEALQLAKTIADEQASAARRKEVEAGKAVATLEERLKSTRSQLEALLQQQKLVGAEEHATRQHPLYNPNEVERHRSKYDERFGDDWQEKNAACIAAITRARSTADNADREAWSLFTTYATNYHKQNVDFGSQDWMRAFQFIQGERKHLQDMELAEQEQKSEEAYEAAVKVFRTDVAQALLAGFDRVDEQMDGLNHVLKVAPEFSNNERYQFRRHVVEQHRALYDFLRRVREQGGDEEDIFGGAGKVPDEFRALVEGDGNSELLNETSPLNDHRRFFSYDVEIFQDGKSIGWLSKRLGPGSGGEHRTPLYVIFGAALAAAYGKANGNTRGGGIMLLDEAFEKMDPQNVRATADYLNALGLQLIMAGPETDQPKMSSFLNVYYDMARFGSRTIQLTKNTLSDKARELLMSDNYLTHPELLEAEVSRFRAVEEVANVAG